jgi:hypothetical protein
MALNVIHQLSNLLFGEQVEREMGRQIGESESNARIGQGPRALACGDYVAAQCRLRYFALAPFGSPYSPKFECRYRAEMEEFAAAERRPDKGTKRDCFGSIAKRSEISSSQTSRLVGSGFMTSPGYSMDARSLLHQIPQQRGLKCAQN